MIGRGLFVLTILFNCVLSLPVTPSQLENEDVKVMKCIVEALADVLSRPHPMPVSQECLVTLKTDDRLVSILRHHNFLKELQEIAVQGGQERSQLQRDAATSDPTTQTPQTASDLADRSMLEALGGPGERSILSQKRRMLNGDGEEEKDESQGDEESQEENGMAEEMQVKRENEERPVSHMEEWSEDKTEKREEEEEDEEYEEKRADSQENSEENMTKEKKGAGSGEKRDVTRSKYKEKMSDEEDEEDKDKRLALFSRKQEEKQHEEEDEGETKRGSRENLKRWTKRGKALSLKKNKAVGKEVQQEVSHHSKEVSEEEEAKKKRDAQRSPEEKELQMIARRGPEERRGSEEEGSASRKSEEPEIESLAAIESELENVAQKLHELRRG
ncbi:uncharacterized protein ABDE67_017176 [Symphorus nematophorus]